MKEKNLMRKSLTQFIICAVILLVLAAPAFYWLTKNYYAEDMGDLIAALLVAFGVHTPEMIARPITMVGNITVPAALMIIGSSMARLPLREIIGSGKVYATSFLRLVIVPLSVYFLFRLCGVNTLINNINTVVIAMPVASFGTMFCMKYGRNPSLMTEATFITTLFSIITIPLITLLFGA